jgi:riboflavin synthase
VRWDSSRVFTGIVQAKGRVAAVRPTPGGGDPLRLVITPRGWDHRPEAGESICVSGCCLTLAAPPGPAGELPFDVVAETLSKTTLGSLSVGSDVNLERSLRASDLMSGHVVQGHVDGVGVVERVQTGADWRIWIRPPPPLMEYLIPKGSVAMEGVSLTLAGVEPGAGVFNVALIPTTLSVTTLGALKQGDRVNLESDPMAKTIVHWLRQQQISRSS